MVTVTKKEGEAIALAETRVHTIVVVNVTLELWQEKTDLTSEVLL
jgi:hypothetical protein